ncbi:MAG: holo-ACP synthase [Pseudomonadota bacterium]
MLGIGTDIVEIARIEDVWTRHGLRFAQRVLTDWEMERLRDKKKPHRFLAKRFAAKEAIAKCFGCGIGTELGWRDMEIRASEKGAPVVELSDRAQAFAQRVGASRVLLSISDERAYAVAFAALVP